MTAARAVYVDDGCRVAAHCLPDVDRNGRDIAGTGCPLATCIYENPEGLLAWIRDHEHVYANKCLQARELRASGIKIQEIADQMKVTRRTVFRLLHRG